MYDGLSEVDPDLWRDIISLQRNWLGEHNGTRIQFNIKVRTITYFQYVVIDKVIKKPLQTQS